MSAKSCTSCGAPLPADAPGGLCPRCLLAGGLNGSGRTSDYAPFSPPSVSEIAALFPQLEIIELLGAGGMGAVYKARQPGLDRLVALKILPQRDDPAFAERFTREARTLAKLSHPGIVAVFDFGQAGGLYYFVMEYVEGVNLRQAERAGKLTPAEALAIVPQICTALQFAHDAGVVHRDIKPENILLDAKARVKIADFGLAKLQDASGPNPLTHTHQVMGTMHYMAPEQWEKPSTVDHRADIYSLGVVFYELLTGELPLGRFPLPSERVQIDVRLDDIVLRTLEKQPERRYQHVSDVKTDVEKVGLPATSAPPMPARGQLNLLLDETDRVRRITQHTALILGCGLLLCAVAARFAMAGSSWTWVASFTIAGSGLLILLAESIKQRWETTYRGHRIVFLNGIGSAERLFIDGARVARGGFGRRMEVTATIPNGEGAGDRIIAWTNAGLGHFRLRLFAEPSGGSLHAPASASALSPAKKRPQSMLRLVWNSSIVGRLRDEPFVSHLAVVCFCFAIATHALTWIYIHSGSIKLWGTGFTLSPWGPASAALLGLGIVLFLLGQYAPVPPSSRSVIFGSTCFVVLGSLGSQLAMLRLLGTRTETLYFEPIGPFTADFTYAAELGLFVTPVLTVLGLVFGLLRVAQRPESDAAESAPAGPSRPSFFRHVALPALALIAVWLIAYWIVRSDVHRVNSEFAAARAINPHAPIPPDSPSKDVAAAVLDIVGFGGTIVTAILFIRWLRLRQSGQQASFPLGRVLLIAVLVLAGGMAVYVAVMRMRFDGEREKQSAQNLVSQQRLIGQWYWQGQRPGYTIFRADGTFEEQETKRILAGTGPPLGPPVFGQYRWLDAERIEARVAGRPLRHLRIVITGDELAILEEDGGVHRMERATPDDE